MTRRYCEHMRLVARYHHHHSRRHFEQHMQNAPACEPKWYAIKRETWMRFIEYLKTIQKPVEELTEEERNLWDCYYIAKEHGKNEKGLLELPWKRWQRVNQFSTE